MINPFPYYSSVDDLAKEFSDFLIRKPATGGTNSGKDDSVLTKTNSLRVDNTETTQSDGIINSSATFYGLHRLTIQKVFEAVLPLITEAIQKC